MNIRNLIKPNVCAPKAMGKADESQAASLAFLKGNQPIETDIYLHHFKDSGTIEIFIVIELHPT